MRLERQEALSHLVLRAFVQEVQLQLWLLLVASLSNTVFELLAVNSSSCKYTSLLFCYLMSPELDQMPWCVLISALQKAWHPTTNRIAL